MKLLIKSLLISSILFLLFLGYINFSPYSEELPHGYKIIECSSNEAGGNGVDIFDSEHRKVIGSAFHLRVGRDYLVGDLWGNPLKAFIFDMRDGKIFLFDSFLDREQKLAELKIEFILDEREVTLAGLKSKYDKPYWLHKNQL